MVDPESDRPLYKQVADVMRAAIRDGRLQPGETIPSERQMAQMLGVSQVPTIRSAYRILTAEGLVVSGRGRLPRVRVRTKLAMLVDELRLAVGALAVHPTLETLAPVVALVDELRQLIKEVPNDTP